MLTRLQNHFGTAGLIVAVVALVAALAGGAIAADGGGTGGGKATASAKGKLGPPGKTGKTGKTGPAGPAGPAGSQGPAGAVGAKGETGLQGKEGPTGKEGSTGKEGAAGKSVTNTTEATGTGNCSGQGGTKLVGTSTTFACNGKEGSPWTAGGTLPSGKTETGAWALTASGETLSAISFNIPLAKVPIAPIIVPAAGSSANCNDGKGEAPSASNPEAAPGYVCIFVGFAEAGGEPVFSFDPALGPGVGAGQMSKTGLGLFFESAAPAFGSGTWALTAE
jgi:hypothetical protein